MLPRVIEEWDMSRRDRRNKKTNQKQESGHAPAGSRVSAKPVTDAKKARIEFGPVRRVEKGRRR